MKKVNNYNLQYWLYAILNKKFGKEVVFERGSLHSRYAVNRHDFTVTSHNVKTQEIARFLKEYLGEKYFVEDSENRTSFKKAGTYINIEVSEDKVHCSGRVYQHELIKSPKMKMK